MNDLPVGRSVDEALRLVQAFQFTVSLSFFFFSLVDGVLMWCVRRTLTVKCALQIGRRGARPSALIHLPNSITLRPLTERMRMTALTGLSARVWMLIERTLIERLAYTSIEACLMV